MPDFAVATYAVYEADIAEFVEYYRAQGVSRMYIYVGRSYAPSEPSGADIEYVAWGDAGAADASTDAVERFKARHAWFAWVSTDELYYIARNISMAEYLDTVTPSFDAVRVQAHLARRTDTGDCEYCKDGLPWTPGEKAGTIQRGVNGAGGAVIDSGVAKKLHLTKEALPGTVYTLQRKS